MGNQIDVYRSVAPRLQVCHSEEGLSPDVGISRYDVCSYSHFRWIVPGDCHVAWLVSAMLLAMTQKLGSWQHQNRRGEYRKPLSLRTSAHTGVAIRSPASVRMLSPHWGDNLNLQHDNRISNSHAFFFFSATSSAAVAITTAATARVTVSFRFVPAGTISATFSVAGASVSAGAVSSGASWNRVS